MGLKASSGAAKWVGISKGKFTTGKGDNKQEFPAFEGLLVGVAFRDSEYNGKKRRDVVLTFLDNELYKISMDSASGYGKQTLMKLPNCDLAKPIELAPTYEEKGDSKKAGMFVSQSGAPVKQKWTKENPGSLPQAKPIEIKGQTVWDDSEQCKWLENFIMQVVAPKAHENLSNPAHADHHATSSDDGGQPEDGGIPEERLTPPGDEVPF